MSEQPSEIESEVRDYVRSEVASGFSTRDEIVAEVPEYFGDDLPDLDAYLVARIVDEELARHALQQAEWDGPTDCDRLDLAFAHLERENIVARQDFSCCGNCGTAEIGDEATPESKGYVFYHMQDTQHAVDGGGLYFNYGIFEEGTDADAIAIGWRLVEALREAGLKPQWEGDLRKRVFVPLVWRKRRAIDDSD